MGKKALERENRGKRLWNGLVSLISSLFFFFYYTKGIFHLFINTYSTPQRQPINIKAHWAPTNPIIDNSMQPLVVLSISRNEIQQVDETCIECPWQWHIYESNRSCLIHSKKTHPNRGYENIEDDNYRINILNKTLCFLDEYIKQNSFWKKKKIKGFVLTERLRSEYRYSFFRIKKKKKEVIDQSTYRCIIYALACVVESNFVAGQKSWCWKVSFEAKEMSERRKFRR